MKIRFSIIIPIYNCEATVDKCVNSVLNQTYKNFEIILINDGSTDNSMNILTMMSKRHKFVHVLEQSNQGAGAARNYGIETAQGEYMVFCDADDCLASDALECLNKAICKSRPDLVVASYHEFVMKNGKQVICGGNTNEPRTVNSQEEAHRAYISLRKNGMISAPWAKAYKADIIHKYDVKFSDIRRCQDVVFNLNYYTYVKSVEIIKDKIYFYHTPDAATYLKKFPFDMFDIHKKVFQLTEGSLKEWGVWDNDADNYLRSAFIRDSFILLRLNHQNIWSLEKGEQKEYMNRILQDHLLQKCIRLPVKNRENECIRLLIKYRCIHMIQILNNFISCIHSVSDKGGVIHEYSYCVVIQNEIEACSVLNIIPWDIKPSSGQVYLIRRAA